MRIAAIDIGGTNLKYALYDTQAPNYQHRSISQAPTAGMQPSAPCFLRNRIVQLLHTMEPFDAIAIAMGGQMNTREARVTDAVGNVPGYKGLEVRKILQESFSVPIYALNDVNAAALGEAVYGAGRGFDDFLCLTYGTGIGGGLILQGKVYEGYRGAAGEFGHIITHPHGEACTCGGRGCYERYAATTALVRMVKERTGEEAITGRQIMERRTETEIAAALEDWLEEIVLGLITLCHALNPPCIVLGGGVMEQKWLSEKVRTRLHAALMRNYRCEVRSAELGNAAGMLGAVAYTLQQLGVQ